MLFIQEVILHNHEPNNMNDEGNTGNYGAAILICEEREDGTLWVSNDEYSSRVNYCPFCGYKAKKILTWK